jgi:hypothetical protein
MTALYDFVNDLGKITRVTGCRELEPETAYQMMSFDEVEFSFERGVFTVVAEGDFDTVALKLAESSTQYNRDISDTGPWNQVIDKPILWAWLLTNQQGYTDGFQFEVKTPDGYLDVQLMCVASSFRVNFF